MSFCILENQELKKLHQILCYVKERPEEKPEAFFREDLYTSPKFNLDKSKYKFQTNQV